METMRCSACKTAIGPDDIICPRPECNANLTLDNAIEYGASPAEETRLIPVAQGELAPRDTDELATASEPQPCPHCGHALNPEDTVLCPRCLTPLDRSVTLTLQAPRWRYVLASGASLTLGRDPQASPAAAVLALHDNVSRRHAEIRVDTAGDVTITDLGSLNGTYLDGRRLPPGQPTPLPGDALLRLARDATFEVSHQPTVTPGREA